MVYAVVVLMTTNAIKIHQCRVIGTTRVVYSAWESSSYCGPHHTVMSIDDVVCGRIGTNQIPPEIAALRPMSQERYEAVAAWYSAQKERAYEAIIAAHPEVSAGERDNGEIVIQG